MKDRFWSKVELSLGCWEWTAAKTSSGYGEFWLGDKMVGAHRVSYELEFGTVPDGLFVCHTCDNPICVKPAHLFLGTHSDNMVDAVRKGRLSNIPPRRVKLTETQVLDIREDSRVHSVIAKDYNVTRTTISEIKRRETWREL